MAWALAVLIGLVLAAVALIGGGLIANRAALSAPPGALARMRRYLLHNVAETGSEPMLPELALPRFEASPEHVYEAVETAVAALGWTVAWRNPSQLELGAVVTTPLWGFRDDVKACVQPAPAGCTLFVRSRSRVGRGDLGANARHIRELLDAMARAGVVSER